jgi:hypothetical protein
MFDRAWPATQGIGEPVDTEMGGKPTRSKPPPPAPAVEAYRFLGGDGEAQPAHVECARVGIAATIATDDVSALAC